jgi:hypothetical protein
MRDPAFLLLAGTLVHNQNPLALSHFGGQRKRSSMSVHGEHVGELVEGFQEDVLPKNMHGDGQYESLAPSDWPAGSKLWIHTTPNVESRPVWAQ